MNEAETTTPTPKPSRKRTVKPSTPRAPRVVDPEVLKIRAEAADKVKQLRLAQKSGGVLKNIIEKQLPKLTAAHLVELSKFVTEKERAA